MEINDPVIHRGRRYLLRGVTRKGGSETQAVLEDAENGEWVTVPLDEVEPELPSRAPRGPERS